MQARELGTALARYAGGLESDPDSLRRVQQRLDLIESLRRKYGPTVEEILAFGAEARQRLEELAGRDEEIRRLEAKKRELEADLRGRCDELTKMRIAGGQRIAKAVAADLDRLGFSGAAFSVRITPADPGPRGADAVDFLFQPNPGEPAKPLRSVASSGEVSRVMLAIKTAFAEQDRVPVLLFDEIDVNVGGEVAHAVGEALQRIADRRQVLCITHLAQVASRADHHFRVGKTTDGGRARTTIGEVAGDARVEEVARMLGGARRASRATDHARQLLESGRGRGRW
jgi:DNA repair protein RecN (Recombination protein N)